MIAFVWGVIASSIRCVSMSWVSRSMSTSTGLAPAWMMVFTVAQKVIGVVITSSPFPIPAAKRERCSPAVHEFSAIAN